MDELRPGLYRWTARHPDWEPDAEADSPADWPELVGSVAYDAGDVAVLVDPLVDDEAWDELDAFVRGRPVRVLTTIGFHSRSRDAVEARYGAPKASDGDEVPPGVVAIPIPDAGETMFWLPEHGALVPGDRLLGDDHGGLRLCPPSWLRYLRNDMTIDRLREELRPLLDLPVELVLVSHGEPVLANGSAAIARALDDQLHHSSATAR
jgi:glyoxylase-like metal-dependent hydrolase (beta-lactamase superfamily II)